MKKARISAAHRGMKARRYRETLGIQRTRHTSFFASSGKRYQPAARRMERFQPTYAVHREDAWCAVRRQSSSAGANPARVSQSLHPVANEAAVEVTKPSEPS
jgi:hypothetical protein